MPKIIHARTIKARLEKIGVTVQEFCQLADIPEHTLRNIFSGIVPASSRLLALCSLLCACDTNGRRRSLERLKEDREWRNIPDIKDYKISSLGEVRRIARRKGAEAGLLLTPFISFRGYLSVTIYENEAQKKIGVHRLVCMAFHGSPPPGKPYACHIDGDRNNNCPSNLYWGSALDNARDRVNIWNIKDAQKKLGKIRASKTRI